MPFRPCGVTLELVERRQDSGNLLLTDSVLALELGHNDPAIGHPQPHVGGVEAEGSHDVERRGHHLRVCRGTRFPDDVHVELEVLPQPPPLLPLVAEQLWD